MFVCINKEKISSYLILMSIVMILFGMASNVRNNKTFETSTGINTNIVNDENE